MNNQSAHDLLPAYVLGALDADEAMRVERALSDSALLRQELAALRAVVGELPYATPPLDPPERVRQQLLARIAASGTVSANVVPSQPSTSMPPSSQPWWRRAAGGLSIVLLLCVLTLAGLTVMVQRNVADALAVNRELAQRLDAAQRMLNDTRAAQQQLNDQVQESRAQLAQNNQQLAQNEQRLEESRRQIDMLAAQLSAQEQDFSFISSPGVATRDLRPASGAPPAAAARMYMRPGDQQAVVIFRGLRALEPGTMYEFWLAKGKEQIAVGSVVTDVEGNARLTIEAPQEVNAFQQVMLTVERNDSQPTRPSGQTVLEGQLAID